MLSTMTCNIFVSMLFTSYYLINGENAYFEERFAKIFFPFSDFLTKGKKLQYHFEKFIRIKYSQILIIYLCGYFVNHQKRKIIVVNNSHFCICRFAKQLHMNLIFSLSMLNAGY
jgi:hypothetical protein